MTITLSALIFYLIGMTQLYDLFFIEKEGFECDDNITVIVVAAVCFSVSVALLRIANM